VQKDLRKKLVLDTIEYILFGYNEKKNLYLFTKIVKKITIIISRDVVFEEMNSSLEYEQNETNLNELLFNTCFK